MALHICILGSHSPSDKEVDDLQIIQGVVYVLENKDSGLDS